MGNKNDNLNSKTKSIEYFRFRELLKASETIIEKNYKLYVITAVILAILQGVYLLVNTENMFVAYGFMIFEAVMTFIVKIFVFKKVNTGFEVVDNKRQKGSLVRQTISTVLIYAGFLVIVVAITVLLAYIYFFVATAFFAESLGMVLLVLFNILLLPLTVASLYIGVIFDSLIIEIFIKNNVKLRSIKDTIKNVNNAANGTLTKLLTGIALSFALSMFVLVCSIVSLNNGFMQIVLSLLLILFNMLIWTYNYIVYMSSIVDKRR